MSTIFRLLFWLLRNLRNAWFQLIEFFDSRTGDTCAQLSQTHANNRAQQTNDDGKEHCVNRKPGLHDPLPFKDMPAAKGLPIVGTIFDLMAAGAAPKLHKYIDRRHQELGSIFRERLGGTEDAVFVSSASLMRSVFLYEGQFPRHPLPDAWTLYNKEHKCQRGLFFMDGVEWSQNRRILNRFLLNGNVEWIRDHVEECTERLISAWQSRLSDNESECFVIEDLENQLYRWAINVICSIMFGSFITPTIELEFALSEFSQIVHKIFECSSSLMNFPPKLAKLLNLRMWQDFKANVAHVLSKGSDIIDMYITLYDDEAQTTIKDSEGLFVKLQQIGMPLDMIKRIFVDLVIAAGDTTAYSSEWALYLLSHHPDLQQRIAKEVKTDSKDTNTIRGLIKETLRLFPVAPFIGRYLACDAVLGNYRIRKNTLVLLSLYTAGRDASHFPKPLHVDPDRWRRNEETGELRDVLQAHGTMPFAIGNRSCIGRKVATIQLDSLIAAVCRNFHLECVNETPIDCILRLVTVPDQTIQLKIKLRDEN